MKYRVETTVKETKKARNGEPYTGVKLSDGRWVNVMGDHLGLQKGDFINLKQEPRVLGNGKSLWAFPEEVQPEKGNAEAPVAGQLRDGILNFYDWNLFVSEAHEVALRLEPNDAQARVALVNTAVIGFLNGKIANVEEPEPGDDVPF